MRSVFFSNPHSKTCLCCCDAVAPHVNPFRQLGQLRLVTVLVDAGADVTKQDHRGTTALALAAQQGWAVACDYLLRRGASPNTKGVCAQCHALITVLS